MKRKPTAPLFKPYGMNQQHLLPPCYDELPATRPIDQIDLSALIARHKGEGTSGYHLQMLLKVLVYVYTQKVYSSLKIAKTLWENIHIMCVIRGESAGFSYD